MKAAPFATPFANELYTNYVPSSQDTDHIRNLLVEPQKRLARLDDKISDLEQVMDALKQERNTLDDEIQKHNHLLSPIRRFPDDMLREIFLACLPDTHNAVMSCAEAPLLLGLICNRWRLLVYSTPRLWASLHIPLPSLKYRQESLIPGPPKYYEVNERHQNAVYDWLLRSGSCPLSISFHVPLEMSDRYDLNFQSYIDIMLNFSHRWYNLEISIPAGHPSKRMASIPSTSVPILTHLRLIFYTRISPEEGIKWKNNYGLLYAPRLRILDISYIPFALGNMPGNYWSHLSSLDLIHTHHFQYGTNFATIQEAYNILSRCSRLTHCALDIFGGDIFSPTGIISLPYLKSLSIIESCPTISTLFECFSDLSKLCEISYQTKEFPSYSRTSPLATLLTRTNNQLTCLAIDFTACTLADLSGIFILVPNLTHLTHENSRLSIQRFNHMPRNFNFEKVTLDLLTPLSNGEIYCPRLQILNINRPSQLSDASILSFLRSRMTASKSPIRNVKPLIEFRARFTREMEVDIRGQLWDYTDKGLLKLSLVYLPMHSLRKVAQFNPHNGLQKRALAVRFPACGM